MAHPTNTRPSPRFALGALAIAGAFAAWTACPARAAKAADAKFQPNLEATVRYLQESQKEDGGFAEPGSEPGSDFSAWVALALAAAGINPRDQTTAKQHYAAGHSAYTYLVEHAHEASLTTDFERELLVVDAAGTSPHDFGGVDLVGEILSRQITGGPSKGAFPHEAGSQAAGINDTIFAILSLSPIHEPAVEAAIARAAEWLEKQQNCDGSWNSVSPRTVNQCGTERRLLPKEATGEIDMTGAALEALGAANRASPEARQKREWAFQYLREGQAPNGGFQEFLTEQEPNVASTAWVVQAMWADAINPETWLTHSGLASEEPLGYLASMQQPDGHIRWRQSEELNGMWMTAYVTPAFTGNALPIPEVPYEPLPPLPPEEPGSGTGGPKHEGGVIAGGGGDGAPLFSRPQPSSKGHTPGGARQLKRRKHDRPRPHRRNPGPARRKIAPTVAASDASRTRSRSTPSHKRTTPPAKKKTGLTGSANHGQGPGGGPAGTGTGSGSAGSEVKGVLIGAPNAVELSDHLEPGAPGLRGAGGGDGDQEQWLTITTYAAIALLILAGALIEHRRPETSP